MPARRAAVPASGAYAFACIKRIERILGHGATDADRADAERHLAEVEHRLPMLFPAPRVGGACTALVAAGSGEGGMVGSASGRRGSSLGAADAGSKAAIPVYSAESETY